ncbi:MAG: flagellar hook protein FlgE [Acidobacteria bacterium]|nr:flagellar hook protein FlgE [Acidobacteriota bacterium]
MSFSASLSGLAANQQKLNVIGNNLANINTVGFKASTVQFMDLVSQNGSGSSVNPLQVGLGVTTGSISPTFSQGGVEGSGVPTHVAIQGNGFFVIGGETQTYTRAGDFTFDSQGMLVNSQGRPVLGYTTTDPVTGNVITNGEPGPIVIPPGVLHPPVATTQFSTNTNLDANAAVGATWSVPVQVYDTLGVSHTATITYTKTGNGAWDYEVTVPGEDVTGGTAGTPSPIGNGTITFDANGNLSQVNGGALADVVITGPTWSNGAAANNITWDLVNANNVGSLTGYRSASGTASTSQNGAPASTVEAISISPEGAIIASMGSSTITVGVVALATFNNPQGLLKLGNNQYGETMATGSANIGAPGSSGRGTLVGSALEGSNVDIAREFTQMILAQRGYQANSKGITVADELFLEAINLKR